MRKRGRDGERWRAMESTSTRSRAGVGYAGNIGVFALEWYNISSVECRDNLRSCRMSSVYSCTSCVFRVGVTMVIGSYSFVSVDSLWPVVIQE